jgi:putative oxidoreductase
MIQFFLVFSEWALLALRIILGLILIAHGWPKIKDLKKTAGYFAKTGFKPGSVWGTIVAVVEFVGGIFLVLGLFTQVIAFLAFIQFLVILLIVKRNAVFKGEAEFDLLILVGLLVLLTMGGGALSLDHNLDILLY